MIESMVIPIPSESDRGGNRVALGVLAAVLGHGLLLALALQQEPLPPALVSVTEVELLQPRVPEPIPELKPEPPAPAAQPRAEHRAARAPAKAPAPAQPASAGPLRTVEEDVKTSDEPVRFVTDPNGSAFGYGTAQRGGTTTAGVAAPMAPPPELAAKGEKAGPAPLLSRAPSLGESEPCRGFFPPRAQVDRGEVALKVRIEADGKVRSVSVSRESPNGHGFGFAARDCLLSKRFSPALDLRGEPVAVLSPVTVRFSR